MKSILPFFVVLASFYGLSLHPAWTQEEQRHVVSDQGASPIDFSVPRHRGEITSIAFSPDGSKIATAGHDAIAQITDAETGALIRTLEGHEDLLNTVTFTPDGEQVITGSGGAGGGRAAPDIVDNNLRLWNLEDGRQVHAFKRHRQWVYDVAVSPDGKHVLTGGTRIRLWRVSDGRLVRTYKRGASAIALSPDGSQFVTDDRVVGGSFSLAEVATGKVLHNFESNGDTVNSVAFAADGRLVLAGYSGGVAKLWNVADGSLVQTFSGHTESVGSVAMSPDGTRILTGSRDQTVRLWDAASGNQLKSFPTGSEWSIAVAYSPDGRRIAAGTFEGHLKVWNVENVSQEETPASSTVSSPSLPALERAAPSASAGQVQFPTNAFSAMAAESSKADVSIRVPEAARPAYGGDCEIERQAIERTYQDALVSLSGREAKSGGTVHVEWSRGDVNHDAALPVFLMVATDQPVRFFGDGFYALTPNARAAFAIESFKGKSRAVVPYYTKGSARSGRIGIRPLQAGPLNVEWSVVGYLRACEQEISGAAGSGLVSVLPGQPRIAAEDAFAPRTPEQVLMSPNQQRKLEVHKGYYRLLDAKTNELLASQVGINPGFSPTGRFVVAENRDKTDLAGTAFDILDTVDGSLVSEPKGITIAWTHGDSFAISTRAWIPMAYADIFAPFSESEGVAGTGSSGGLTFFENYEQLKLSIDLENGVAVTVSNPRDQKTIVETTSLNDSQTQSLETILMPGLSGLVSPPLIPKGLDFDYGGKFFHHSVDGHTPTGNIEPPVFGQLLAKYAISASQPIGDAPEIRADDEAHENAKAVAWRSSTAQRGSFEARHVDGFLASFADFGFVSGATSPVRLVRTARNKDFFPRWGMRASQRSRNRPMEALVKEIRKELPQLRKYLGKNKLPLVPPLQVQHCVHDEDPALQDMEGWRLDLTEDALHVWTWSSGGSKYHLVQILCAMNGPDLTAYYSDYFFLGGVNAQGRLRYPGYLEHDNPIGKLGTQSPDGRIPSQDDITVSVHETGHILVVNKMSSTVTVFADNGKRVEHLVSDLRSASTIVAMHLSQDQRHLLQLNRQGTFYLYATATGELVLEGRYIDNEIIAWTSDMRFDASVEGAHFVNLEFPGVQGKYAFQQFNERLRKPGLVQEVLGGRTMEEPLEIGVPPRLTASLSAEDDARIVGSATIQTTDDEVVLHIYQDGVPTDRLQATPNGETPINVARRPGARWAAILAADSRGLVSLPVGRDLGRDMASLPAIHTLAVGIDDYEAPEFEQLSFAKSDAKTILSAIEDAQGKTLDVRRRELLTDQDARPEAIIEKARGLVDAAKEGETIVFFFAGHGVRTSDGLFYMATSGTDPGAIPETSLSWRNFADIISGARARVVVFLDTCHSGAAGTDFFATNDNATADMMRGLTSNVVIIAASKGRELSEEAGVTKGGVFTNAVADVIARKRSDHDLNNNGVIEISELFSGVKHQVVHLTQGRQTPWLARNRLIGDFSLF